jgi:branched-chain amino acid transport system substrate-binding protein
VRGRLLAVLAVAGAFALAGCGGSEPDAASSAGSCPASGPTCVRVGVGQPIYLGELLNLTTESGTDVQQSLRLAVDYLDGVFDGAPGQLLGHDVEVLSQEDECSAVGGRTGALRLLQEPSLVAVVGTTCSTAALGAADAVLAEANVLMVSPSNTAPSLTDPERRRRTYFRVSPNDALQASAVADFAYVREGWRSAVTVHAQGDVYSEQLAGAFGESLTQLGGELLADLPVGPASPAAAVARQVAALGPDVVLITAFSPECEQAAAAIRAVPALRRLPIVVSEACQTAAFLQVLGADAAGIYASSPDFTYLEEDAFYRDGYLPAYRRQTGGDPIGVYHAHAFDGFALIADAIRRTAVVEPGGALSIDREQLRRALLQVRGYQGLSGRLTCGSTGDCAEGARVAIYRAPDWPVARGAGAKPVFRSQKTLAQFSLGG